MSSDQNLLFGILALQMDFVRREQLIAATSTWLTDKTRSLGGILIEQGALSESDHELLQPLVARHIENHGDDPGRSLAAVSGIGSLAVELRSLGDSEIDATLAGISPGPPTDPDPSLTVDLPANGGGRFRVLRPHAKGGLGAVSVAKDTEVNREVALKEILPKFADDEQSRARFLLEAEITGGLEHPGVVPVYGLGRYDDGRPFYAMRFIRGDSLQQASRRFHDQSKQDFQSVEFRKLLGRFIDVCEAIEYAHSRGVLHRDLKPGNIMLGKYGETLVVDWGLAKALGRAEEVAPGGETALRPSSGSGSAPTQMGSAIGTPAFMPPEQALGNLDQLGPQSDTYSLGATLYYLLCGRRPFESESVEEVLQGVQRGEFPKPREVQPLAPKPLEAICLKAMSLRIDDRYAAPTDLAEDIQCWLGDEPVSAHADSTLAKLQRWVRRHQTLAASIAMLVLVGLAALGVSTILIGNEQRRTATALTNEKAARKDADDRRQEADRLRIEADGLRETAENALLEKQRVAANLAFDRAQTLSENGDAPQGLHWYLRALSLAPPEDQAFDELIRYNLGAWQAEIIKLEQIVDYPEGDNRFNRVQFTREGKAVIAGPNSIFILDTIAGKIEKTLPCPDNEREPRLVGSGDYPIALSLDEQFCAAGIDAKVYFWRLGSGEREAEPIKVGEGVSAIRFSPAGDAVALTTKSGEIRFYNRQTRMLVRKWKAHNGQANCLAFRPDGKVLMTAGWDARIKRWDPETGESAAEDLQLSAAVTNAAWGPAGRRIVASGMSGIVRMWDLEEDRVMFEFPPEGADVQAVAFSPDGRRLAIGDGDGRVRICDAATGKLVLPTVQHGNAVPSVTFDADGSALLTTSSMRLHRWRLPKPVVETTEFNSAVLNRSAIQPRSDVLVFASMRTPPELIDIKTGKSLGVFEFPEAAACLAFSDDGARLAISGFRGSCRVFSTVDRKPLGPNIKVSQPIMCCILLDETRLVFATLAGFVTVVNFKTGEVLGEHIMQASAAHVDRFGDNLVVTDWSGGVKVWDLKTRTELQLLAKPGENPQWSDVGFSPDGRYIAAGGVGEVRLWARDTGEQVMLSQSSAKHIDFGPEGRFLAVSGTDNVARLWHLATQRSVGPLRKFPQLQMAHIDQQKRLICLHDQADFKTRGVSVSQLPEPMPGSEEALRLRIETITGRKMVGDGRYATIPSQEWIAKRKRLAELLGANSP